MDDQIVPRPRRIGFVIFSGVTALDFVGPMDAFAAAFINDGAVNRDVDSAEGR